MSTKFTSYGMSQTYANGEKISDFSYDATYDGNHANISTSNGNTKTFMRLSNNDIEKYLNEINAKYIKLLQDLKLLGVRNVIGKRVNILGNIKLKRVFLLLIVKLYGNLLTIF